MLPFSLRVQVSLRRWQDRCGTTYATWYCVIFTSYNPGTMTAFGVVKANVVSRKTVVAMAVSSHTFLLLNSKCFSVKVLSKWVSWIDVVIRLRQGGIQQIGSRHQTK
ncbi:unnamed protein product [Hydatigera taeniaeformis]|uniref:Uncharacterized protein n=1 Tax=Hydatigena taeniaeformis TaxID=6205 RepID=A0A3P7GGU8_HYDTA|nr:unnamed protein product [Hydatigera taeniaeformis]